MDDEQLVNGYKEYVMNSDTFNGTYMENLLEKFMGASLKWSLHPKWDKIYLLTDNSTGITYKGVIVRDGLTDKVLVEDSNGKGNLMNRNTAESVFTIKVLDSVLSPTKFMNNLLKTIG